MTTLGKYSKHGIANCLFCTVCASFLTAVLLPASIALAQDDVSGGSASENEETSLLDFLVRGNVVDEEGKPVGGATIEIISRVDQPPRIVKAFDNGAFLTRVKANGYYGVSLLVHNPERTKASFVSRYDLKTVDRGPLKVTVTPFRTTTVTVADESGVPVENARVVVQAKYEVVARAATGADGKAMLSFPTDAKVDWINAFKPGAGYDYHENYNAFPTQERLDVPDEVALVLNGASKVAVKALDSAGRPLEGIIASPWTIKKRGKISYANLGGAMTERTNEEGIARFDWIPSDLEQGVTMLLNHDDYHCPNWPRYSRDSEEEVLEATLFENAIVHGTISYSDGSPAAGIRLQGEGRGATNHYFRGHTMTDEDGKYEIKIYPDQDTILAVTDDRYAASSTGIELGEGEQQQVDLILQSGTLIHGVFTVGPDDEPWQGETATLIQKEGKSSLVRWSESDENGRYQFRVGPGAYELRLASDPPRQITVETEEEFAYNAHSERRLRETLRGKVVDSSGAVVANAAVYGESLQVNGHAGFHTQTDEEGAFASERWTDEMLVYAVQNSEKLAGYKQISEDDREMQLVLDATATVLVSVVDDMGDAVVHRDVSVALSLRKRGPNGSIQFWTTTDGQGKCSIAVPEGMLCNVRVKAGEKFTEPRQAVVDAIKDYPIAPFVISDQ